jgi:hypothetical protein
VFALFSAALAAGSVAALACAPLDTEPVVAPKDRGK